MKITTIFKFICFLLFTNYLQAQIQGWVFHVDQNIRPAYTIGGEVFYGMEIHPCRELDILHGPAVGIEVSPFKNVFIVPKASYKLTFINQIMSVKTGFMMPTDFKTTDFRWYSGVGVSIADVLNISYEYSQPFNDHSALPRVSRHNINFQFIFPFPEYKI